jgi:hypothetical protein
VSETSLAGFKILKPQKMVCQTLESRSRFLKIMEVIEINIPAGLPDRFFCPLSGEPAMTEFGSLAVSCIAYIPPLAFHDAIIGCPTFDNVWEDFLKTSDMHALQENISGEFIQEFLEAYDGPAHQKLIGFKVVSTSLRPLVAPEFEEPIYTIPLFYVINFWAALQ